MVFSVDTFMSAGAVCASRSPARTSRRAKTYDGHARTSLAANARGPIGFARAIARRDAADKRGERVSRATRPDHDRAVVDRHVDQIAFVNAYVTDN
jgi:hypothetical protein